MTSIAALVATASHFAQAAGKMTFVSQGGAYQEAQTKAILDPAAKQLGITIAQDSIPDAWPQVKAQGATGKPIWDVIDTPTSNCLRGGREGLIEKLDFEDAERRLDSGKISHALFRRVRVLFDGHRLQQEDAQESPAELGRFLEREGFPRHARAA
jgi:spermidine/putrescine-binding protein